MGSLDVSDFMFPLACCSPVCMCVGVGVFVCGVLDVSVCLPAGLLICVCSPLRPEEVCTESYSFELFVGAGNQT